MNMDTHSNEHQYISFPLAGVNHDMIPENVDSHEEICSPVNECILSDSLANEATRAQVAVEILTEHTSNDVDEKSMIYPIYIKQEEHQQYTSGDDESMAVEALRQLGGMYPCFEDKKTTTQNSQNLLFQSPFSKQLGTLAILRLSCTTCGENFERKQDLDNHMVCHQVDRPHACRTCGNLFRSKANLQTHMIQVHQVEKLHKCTICGAEFHRPSSLSNHMKIHTYVAGRAVMQSQSSSLNVCPENLCKWLENEASSRAMENTSEFSAQWSVVPYNFSEQTSTVVQNTEKINPVQEFTVMPNGEVTHFEYSQDPLTDSLNHQYNITLNNYTLNSATTVKVEALTFPQDTCRNEVDVEIAGTLTKLHMCIHCGASFTRARLLALHEKMHASKTPWPLPIECEYCDKQFQDATHLANHQATCAKKMMQSSLKQGTVIGKWSKHVCTECGKKFTTKQKMFRHKWIHRKKTYTCEICAMQFEQQSELDEHRLSAHPGDSPFTCTECGKSFVSRQGLWEHGRTHAGSPAHFHCDTCSKTFSSRQGYLIHHRTHTGERPYGCKFCWKAFRDGGTLRKHERIHTGERPHVCPLCSRAFNQKVVLREHVRWVHAAGKNETEASQPPFPCPLCCVLTQDRDELCAHIVKHSDQMIAEAKARSNGNATKKSKMAKKTTRPSAGKSFEIAAQNGERRSISRDEETVALLSITENAENFADGGENEERLLIGGDRDEFMTETEIHAELTNVAIDKSLVAAGIEEIARVDINILKHTQKQNETPRLITTGSANNTLHLITKQNKALPVLTITNDEQGHDNFSSQLSGMTDEDASFLQEEHRESGGENEEMVCGICGDDFDDKNVLMEHVKIHI